MKFSTFLLSLLLNQISILLAEHCTTGCSVVAPELAVPGKTTAVLVTLHDSNEALNVTLRLLPEYSSDGINSPLTEVTQEIRGHGVLPFEIPADISGSCTLQTLINCTKNNKCELESSSLIRLVGPVRDVIIRPAKHAYGLGETASLKLNINGATLVLEKDGTIIDEDLILKHFQSETFILLEPHEKWKDNMEISDSTSKASTITTNSTDFLDAITIPLEGTANNPIENDKEHPIVCKNVSFWVLALNHDLQIATNSIGSISIKDPAGTKVAIWDQVPLDEGVKAFTLLLSDNIRSGKWLIHVEVESAEFWTTIEIAPGVGNGLPDVAVAEEHYVELRFGREMRRRYKPGLPFAGKVEAMSTEKSVRVRVKVYDNTTSIYSQDIEISNGEGTFVVPAILADSDIIALQAELVSVESKEIESHYVLAREPIHKWNSSSDCYLLIEGVEHTLQPEEDAHVNILSTCPCERDLHYIITTDGRITDWAQRRYKDILPPTTSSATGAVCRLNFSFTVQSVMAPVSQLLVYYVTSEGEPVSDVISFDVKLLDKQVYVNVEEREWWLPGQSLDLEVVAEPSSLVCLLGGRSGGNGDIKFDPRISEERESGNMPGEIDFLEAGVSFFQRQCVKRGNSGISAISYRQRGSGAGPSNRRRPPESLVGGAPFDQLWLWKCLNYSSETSSTGLTISAPQEAGKWSLWALTVSNSGLRFSSSVNLEVFRPLQVEFHLPPSLRVRETLEVDIKLRNSINSCMDVTALLALSEGAQFLSNSLLYVTERLRLGPHGATSLVVRLLVTTPGVKNMTVEVNGYTTSSCEGSNSSNNASLAGAVVRSATVHVHPEGIVRTDTESAYFCANENLVVSTIDNYKFEWISAPHNHEGVIIEMKVGNSQRLGPLHIALAETRSLSDKMYQITVGDADNTVTHIGRGKHGYGIQLTSKKTPDILSQDEWRTFWVTWEKNVIAFGNGSDPHNNPILKWKIDKKIKIQHIGFSSTWGSAAEFRIWNFNEESGFSQVLHLDTPKSMVPGSEWGNLLITGGLALPAINRKIEGRGLTAALASLTSLLAIQHLENRLNESDRMDALQRLPGHIQTVLSFRKVDNSFSEHQMLGSHRLTIYTLEALTKVQTYFSVDPDLIQAIKRWVQLRQEDDGRFIPLPGDVKFTSACQLYSIKKNLTSEALLMENVVEITAETVITLYEIGVETDSDTETLEKAKIFLENSLPNIETPDALSAVTLALVLVRSATAAWAIEKLKNASTTEDGEFGWPHFMTRRDAADWLYESESVKTLKEPLITTAEEYKASLYSLSTFCLIGDLKAAESVARYLFYRSYMLDKHYELLYTAVKVFSQYDSLSKDHHRSLTVSLATSGMELTDTLELQTNRGTQLLHLPSLPTKVFVYATGAGCATIQGKITYSTYSTTTKTILLEIWSEVVKEILPDRSSVEEIEGKLPMLKIKTCFKWKGPLPSGVLRLEVTLFSGYELANTPQLITTPEVMSEMQHNSNANKLWFIFANVSSPSPICVQYTARSSFVISSLRPAYAKIFPATREDLAAETFFHTKFRSNLLKSITVDDIITWFGNNSTDNENSLNDIDEWKSNVPPTTTSISPTTVTNSPVLEKTIKKITDTSISPGLLKMLSEATYTINISNHSIVNLTEYSTVPYEDSFSTLNTDIASIKISDSSIVTTQSNKFGTKFPNLILDENQKIPKEKLSTFDRAVQKQPNKMNAGIKALKTIKNTGPYATKKSAAEALITGSRHVNLKIQDIPGQLKRQEAASEDNPVTFAPDIKNDQYILLNKEALWGMLKEVVNDGMKKKLPSKIFDEKSIRSSFT